ncbi:MAG: alpha/beta fold hydrolase [Candidatus Marinimicrobia bacterium]|jgi:dipeptidyl-peptidase-4|nr:alpha/beta fold hydrolase [Candidatus Neomarinimicrobiota bacterium]
MKLTGIGICLLISTSLIFTQDFRKLTVHEMVDDPGLNAYAYREKQFAWTPDGDAVVFLEKNKNQQYDLLSFSVESRRVDTLLKFNDMIWREGESTVHLDPRSFVFASDGGQILLHGGRDLFLYNRNDTTISRLTTDGTKKTDVRFSPDGKMISFISEHNLWIVDCTTKTALPLTNDGSESLLNGEADWVYEEEFDLKKAYQWSPDSKMIAYMQINENGVSRHPLIDWSITNPEVTWQYYPNAGEKTPENNVFVVDIITKNIILLDKPQPKNEYIVRIDWLSDTNLVAVQSINRLQNNKRLTYCNPATGEVKIILEQKDPYWLNVADLYHFMANSSDFIYYSEKDGYMHLYLYNYAGKIIKPITQGEWMVTELNGVNEEDSLIYFSATKKSFLERNLYSVHLGSGEIVRIDNESGEHSAVFSPDMQYYLDFYNKINAPTSVRIFRNNGKKIADLYRNPDFDSKKYNFGTTRFFKISAMDGDSLYTSIIYPNNFDPQKKYPVIVYVYGGPGSQVVRNSYSGVWRQLLAQQGYLVFSLDNRGSYGRGRNFERRIYQQFGKLELQDQLEGVKFLKSLPYVDPQRIGIWGASYGGYMTLLALSKAPDVFKTGVAIAPVTYWKYYDAIYTERYMGLPKDHQFEYRESSPINFVDNINANFLLIHGTADDNVHLQQSLEMINELIKKNKHFEMLFYPGRQHGVSDREGKIHMYETFLEFLRRNF